MQRIFIDNHDRILYYSNPAGYIAEKEAVVDTMFQTQELERFLQKQALTIRWEDGVYDRLLLGQRGGSFDPEAPPLKSCRVWQLTRDSPINMRFIPYEALLERFGQPDRKHYETVYDGLVGTNDPEEIYTLFRDPVPGYVGCAGAVRRRRQRVLLLRPCRLPADRVCTPAGNGYKPVK